MDLSPYLESVRVGVAVVASPTTKRLPSVSAWQLSSTRLALIQALSDAAGTISAELAPSSVELRMVGQDPEFVVSVQSAGQNRLCCCPSPNQVMRTPASHLTTSPFHASRSGCPSR